MEDCISRDQKFRKFLPPIIAAYLLVSLSVIAQGILTHDPFETVNALGTLMLIPSLCLLRRIFHLKGGWGLIGFIYIFICLSWTIGGAANVYNRIPGFDKLVHTLSGIFVSTLALAGYRMMDSHTTVSRKYPLIAYFFVFFASMAVAALFEITEFTLAPLLNRDLQHVLQTGVQDTMMDMIVCLAGTVLFILLMVFRSHGHRELLTGAAEAFALQNMPS